MPCSASPTQTPTQTVGRHAGGSLKRLKQLVKSSELRAQSSPCALVQQVGGHLLRVYREQVISTDCTGSSLTVTRVQRPAKNFAGLMGFRII